jgi:putative FmdB family regulatory protein
MPTYEFFCKPCNAIDEVVRAMKHANDPYQCPDCSGPTKKLFSRVQTITKGEDQKLMHPAFGTPMTNREAAAEAKRRGWIEVGNEDVGKHTEPPKRASYDENDYFL